MRLALVLVLVLLLQACTTAAAAGAAAAAIVWRLQADGILSPEDAQALVDAMGGGWLPGAIAGIVGSAAAQVTTRAVDRRRTARAARAAGRDPNAR